MSPTISNHYLSRHMRYMVIYACEQVIQLVLLIWLRVCAGEDRDGRLNILLRCHVVAATAGNLGAGKINISRPVGDAGERRHAFNVYIVQQLRGFVEFVSLD